MSYLNRNLICAVLLKKHPCSTVIFGVFFLTIRNRLVYGGEWDDESIKIHPMANDDDSEGCVAREAITCAVKDSAAGAIDAIF